MTARELREFTLACACHIVAAIAVRLVSIRRVLLLSSASLPRARHPISFERLTTLVARSRRVCRGSCLTEGVVLRALAARNGHPELPLTVGVARSAGILRAHAWTGERGASSEFTPLWTPARSDAAEESKHQ